jgi:HEAT repeat protein
VLEPGDAFDAGAFERARAMTISLDKVVRGLRLYRGGGEMVERMLEELVEKAGAATADGALTFQVTALGLSHQGRPATSTETRSPYLFQLYCDGVRELTFLEGLDGAELRALAGVLAADARHSDEDLVTLLWKQQLQHVRYYAVDAFVAGTVAGAVAAAGMVQRDQLAGGEAGEILALSAQDVRVLQSDEALDWVRAARVEQRASGPLEPLAQAVRVRFGAPPDYGAFLAIARRVMGGGEAASGLVLDLFDGLVQDRADREALELLEAIAQRPESPEGRELVQPERMGKLAPLVEAHALRTLGPLSALLRAHPDAAGPLALLTRLHDPDASAAFEGLLRELGLDITPFYAGRLESDDEREVLGAVDALGELGTPEAMEAVTRALSNALTRVRHAALEALQAHYQPTARVALGRSLQDPDKDNRLLALKVVGASGDKRFGWALVHVVDAPEFDHLDEDEQQAFYDAIAALHDDRTLEHFRRLLSRRTLLGARAVAHHQVMAARALAAMQTPAARALLEDHRERWFHAAEVREAVAAALSNTAAPNGGQP